MAGSAARALARAEIGRVAPANAAAVSIRSRRVAINITPT